MNRDIEHKASIFAEERHKGQKHGIRPFREHLLDVVLVLSEFGYGDSHDLLAAAWLHDVVEDTNTTTKEIYEAFGNRIGDLVDALTDGPGKTRLEMKQKPYRMLPKVEGGVIVKLADRIANVRNSISENASRYIKTYKSEYPGFRQALYIPGQADPMWETLDKLLGDI
jgi:guanosine-3',5'-bis(diphosphate) 3'-pyrophosphohydrolase